MAAQAAATLIRRVFDMGAVFSFSFSSVSLAEVSCSRLANVDLSRCGSGTDDVDRRRCAFAEVDFVP